MMNGAKGLFWSAPLWCAAAALGASATIGCDAGRTSDQSSSGAAGGGGSAGAGDPASAGAGMMSSSAAAGGGGSPNGGYYVQGNTVRDANGKPHLFHGIARPSLEWNNMGEHISQQDYKAMAGWGANVIRVALNQRFWLQQPSYQSTIDQSIKWIEDAGMDVILDLHWSDKGNNGVQPGQQRMADANSVTFWQSVASRYKSDGRVIFELYNEPHDVSWDVWLNGGDSGDGFQAVGMQQLYGTVRSAGAANLVIVGGLDYAYDLSGVSGHRVQGKDIVYTTHPYSTGNKQPGAWQNSFGYLTATDPVLMTEFGVINGSCDTSYYVAAIDFADKHNMGWTAWAWYPKDCSFPSLITDWNGTPSQSGQIVKTALLGYAQ